MTLTEIAQQDVIFQMISLLFVVEILLTQIYQIVISAKTLKRFRTLENIDRREKVNEERRQIIALYWILAMMGAVIHSIIFYAVLNLDRYTTLQVTPLGGSYTTWSSILRLHWYGTVGIIEAGRAAIEWGRYRGLH